MVRCIMVTKHVCIIIPENPAQMAFNSKSHLGLQHHRSDHRHTDTDKIIYHHCFRLDERMWFDGRSLATLGTAAWNRKSLTGSEEVLMADRTTTATPGDPSGGSWAKWRETCTPAWSHTGTGSSRPDGPERGGHWLVTSVTHYLCNNHYIAGILMCRLILLT